MNFSITCLLLMLSTEKNLVSWTRDINLLVLSITNTCWACRSQIIQVISKLHALRSLPLPWCMALWRIFLSQGKGVKRSKPNCLMNFFCYGIIVFSYMVGKSQSFPYDTYIITAKGKQCHFDVDFFFGVYLLYVTYNISYHKHFDNGSSGEIEMIPSYVPILR